MNNTRLTATDTIVDVLRKMSEGNPGCVKFLSELLQNSKNGGALGGFGHILPLDTLGLYGSQAYMLWNDCCNRDLEQVELFLRNFQMGKLSKKVIHDHLAGVRGIPLENLITLEE